MARAGWRSIGPDWLRAAGALNECGGVSMTVAGVRFYPIMVAEKGFAPYRIHVSGTWGHGSMPRDDNAAVIAAEIVARLAVPGPIRMTPVMSALPGGRGRRATRRDGLDATGDRRAASSTRRRQTARSTGCATRSGHEPSER